MTLSFPTSRSSDLPSSDHRQESDRTGARRPARRRVEGRLCRLRHRDDGLFPADVAARRDDREAAQGARRLFRADDRPDETGHRGVDRPVRRRIARRSRQISPRSGPTLHQPAAAPSPPCPPPPPSYWSSLPSPEFSSAPPLSYFRLFRYFFFFSFFFFFFSF